MLIDLSLYTTGLGIQTVILCAIVTASTGNNRYDNNIAVNNFRDYLRIETQHPHPDYEKAIVWVEKQAKELNLEFNLVRGQKSKDEFALWLTWPGQNPAMESILFHSHIDVVPVNAADWIHQPFGGEIDEDGNIYGRGAQDMKSAAVQYLEAVRGLKAKGYSPNRTIHISFFPDEEVGTAGMLLFAATPEFANLNLGLMIDEGLPNEVPGEFNVFYGQRQSVWVKFTARGKSGHGSLLLDDTAAEKLMRVISRMFQFRTQEKDRLERNKSLRLGDVTTINLSFLKGGLAGNIVPGELSAQFDIRMPPHWTYNDITKLLNETCIEAGPNVTYEILSKIIGDKPYQGLTKLDNNTWWWPRFQNAFTKMNYTVLPSIFPAGSDGQVVRRLATPIPVLGFSPVFNTTMHFHDVDEYLNAEVYLKGIEIYENLMVELATVPAPPPPPTTTSTTTAAPAPVVVVGLGGTNGTMLQNVYNMSSPSTTMKTPKGKSDSSSLLPTQVHVLLGIFALLTGSFTRI